MFVLRQCNKIALSACHFCYQPIDKGEQTVAKQSGGLVPVGGLARFHWYYKL